MATSYSGADSRAGGGATPGRLLNLNATGQIVKASAGRVYGYHITNSGAAAAYVKLYNKATAPTASDTPVRTIYVAATSRETYSIPVGIGFSAGISARAVTGVADNDNTGAGSNEVIANIDYA